MTFSFDNHGMVISEVPSSELPELRNGMVIGEVLYSNLPDLPTEIIELVCENIQSASDVGSLRLTCRTLTPKATNSFAGRHFAGLKANLTDDGLQALVTLTTYATFASAGQILRIWPAYFCSHLDGETLVRRHEVDRYSRKVRATTGKVRDMLESQQGATDMGEDVRILAHALKSLPRLSVICIGCPIVNCRSGRHGSRYLTTNCKIGKTKGSPRLNALSYAFDVTVRGLNRSPAAITELHVCISPGHEDGHDSLLLHELQPLGPSSAHWLSALEELDLSMEIFKLRDDYDHTRLAELLALTPNLKKLRLQLWYAAETKYHCSELYTAMLQQAELPQLESLQLVKGTCDGAAFLSFLARHRKTLKNVLLHKFVFRNVEWSTTLLPGIQDLCCNLDTLTLRWIGTERGVLRSTRASAINLCRHYMGDEMDPDCAFCPQSHVVAEGTAAVRVALTQRLPAMSIHGWEHALYKRP